MRKLFVSLISLLAFVFIFSLSSVQANEIGDNNDLSDAQKEYDSLIEAGHLDESVTYEIWSEINNEGHFEEFKAFDEDISTFSGSYGLRDGDILVSNATSFFGLTGHAGIYVGNSEVLHIEGPGHTPSRMSVFNWIRTYGIGRAQQTGLNVYTNVYRVESQAIANAASAWAKVNYVGTNYDYGITMDLLSKNPTYCSKIVWQAYNSLGLVNFPVSHIAAPYSLPDYFIDIANVSHVGSI